MESSVLTKKEAVELYGSDKCKRHFATYKKLTNKDIETSLVNEMKRFYEKVEVIKIQNSRAYGYKLSGKKEVVSEKEDGRISNGAYQIPYTRNIDIMVTSQIERNTITQKPQVLSKWCLDFGLINQHMYELFSIAYDENLKKRYLKELKSKKVIKKGEERLLNDFVMI